MACENDLKLSNGSLELLKWLAILLMTGDHVSTFLFNGQLEIINNMGRAAMPIFAFVFAYNLNRPHAHPAHKRTASRLLVFGLLATPFYVMLTDSSNWLPLNILFTLLAGMICIITFQAKRYIELAFLFLFIGLIVEYYWFGLALIILSFHFLKCKTTLSSFLLFSSLAFLFFINGNHYALIALPVVIIFGNLKVSFPRFKWVFYIYYPVHLAVLLLIKTYLNYY